MMQRLKRGRDIFVRIEGRYGVYTTKLRLGRQSQGNKDDEFK